MSSKINIVNALCICILFIFLWAYFFKVIEIQKSYLANGWIIGDWLINYSGGFVRRGLLGEIILKVGSIITLPLQELVLILKFFLYAIFCISFFLLALKKKEFGVVELILFLAPWSIIFDLHDKNGSGRKELLLISIFTFYTFLHSFKEYGEIKFYKRWHFWFLLIILPFLTLTHEGLFFFYQYFFLSLLMSKKSNKNDFYVVAIPYLISALVILILGFGYRGDEIIADKICHSLLEAQVDPSVCVGAISSLGGFNFTVHLGYYKIYIPSALLTFVPLICYGLSTVKMNPQNFLLRFLILIIPTIPMYFLAADWGRWIHLTGLLIFVSMMENRDSRKIKFENIPLINIFLISFGLYIYIFRWKIPHWIGDYKKINIMYENFSTYINNLF